MIHIPVDLGARSYRIVVGARALAGLGSELSGLRVGRKVAVFTDPAIRNLHGGPVLEGLRAAGYDVTEVILPEGERAKTLEVAGRAWDQLLAAGCDRSSTVVALGGGAVGDLGGFAAATYMRGMNLVQAPTTLLAQVDASVGGKTAIDHPRAKNLIGAFHQPRLVVVDIAVLLTLPEREFRAGLAEVVKHGIVLDARYFRDLEDRREALLRRDLPTLEHVVAGSCRIKAAVVERDEQEAELRQVLNYGHTVGHALEAATGYGRWAHGEAVALGMVAEARIAERLGLAVKETTQRQVDLLRGVGLPVSGLGAAPEAIVEAMSRDKKARDGRLPLVLAPEIGRFQIVYDVPRPLVLETLHDLSTPA